MKTPDQIHTAKMRPSPRPSKEKSLPDINRKVRQAMAALIDGAFGCLDSASETIRARGMSDTSIGTLSRRFTGALDWTVADVVALEDAAGQYPITRMLARRMSAQEVRPAVCLTMQAGEISKEVGEAVHAILKAEKAMREGSADVADARAAASVEINQAMDKLRAALVKLDDHAVTQMKRGIA